MNLPGSKKIVWFFGRARQPGQRGLLWTVQLDVDVPLVRPRH
ncbi:MAG TPA: hypothetical protein VFL83_07195 [Anaeromyxobacter sp.]|nr:hypothetical protein [Anaeromyxobacter sp.]